MVRKLKMPYAIMADVVKTAADAHTDIALKVAQHAETHAKERKLKHDNLQAERRLFRETGTKPMK